MHPDAKPEVARAYYDGIMQRLNEARDALTNPKTKAKHDAKLRAERERAEAPEEEAPQEEEQHTRQEPGDPWEEYEAEEDPEDAWEAWEEYEEPPHGTRTAPPPPPTSSPPPRPARPRVEIPWHLVPWRAVALTGGALVVIFGAWSCMSAVFDSFETATRSVAQSGGKTEKAPAISAAELEEAEEELGEYFAAHSCAPCNADALTAAVEAHVSEDFWDSPNGRELQRSTAKVARGQELRQEFKLSRFERNEPGPFAQWNEKNELRGTAYYDGRVIENGKDDGPIRGGEAKVRMQRTEAGGWAVSYAS